MILRFFIFAGILWATSNCGFGAALSEEDTEGDVGSGVVASRVCIEPTPNGYGYYIDGCRFHQRAAAMIYERAAQHPEIPLKIYEPGAGKGSFLRVLLSEPQNATHPILYHSSDLHEGVYPVLDEIIATYSKNSENKFGKARAGKGDMRDFLKGKEAAYDVIAPFMMLHFLMPWQLPVTLLQIHRSLKPNGLLVGTVALTEEEGLRALYLKEGQGVIRWPSFWGFLGQVRRNGAYVKAESTRGDRQGIHSLFMHYFIKEQFVSLLTAFGFDVRLCEEDTDVGILCFKAQKRGATTLSLNPAQFDSITEGLNLQGQLLEALDQQGIPVPPGWREKSYEFLLRS